MINPNWTYHHLTIDAGDEDDVVVRDALHAAAMKTDIVLNWDDAERLALVVLNTYNGAVTVPRRGAHHGTRGQIRWERRPSEVLFQCLPA
jgi:hypothetical protein